MLISMSQDEEHPLRGISTQIRIGAVVTIQGLFLKLTPANQLKLLVLEVDFDPVLCFPLFRQLFTLTTQPLSLKLL